MHVIIAGFTGLYNVLLSNFTHKGSSILCFTSAGPGVEKIDMLHEKARKRNFITGEITCFNISKGQNCPSPCRSIFSFFLCETSLICVLFEPFKQYVL